MLWIFHSDAQSFLNENFIQSNILSSWFISIPTSKKFKNAVRYIHNNKSWKRCYVLLKIFFLVWEFFAYKILIIQELTKFNTIIKWPRSALRKQYLILVFGNYSQTYHTQPIYVTCLMIKVMKKIHYQMIILSIHTKYVLSYQSCRLKERII